MASVNFSTALIFSSILSAFTTLSATLLLSNISTCVAIYPGNIIACMVYPVIGSAPLVLIIKVAVEVYVLGSNNVVTNVPKTVIKNTENASNLRAFRIAINCVKLIKSPLEPAFADNDNIILLKLVA